MTIELIGRITEPDDRGLSPEEIDRLLRVEPLTGAEIVTAGLTSGWEDQDISDGQTWIAEQRRRRASR